MNTKANLQDQESIHTSQPTPTTKRKYVRVTPEQRATIISNHEAGMQLRDNAKDAGVNYESTKAILRQIKQ